METSVGSAAAKIFAVIDYALGQFVVIPPQYVDVAGNICMAHADASLTVCGQQLLENAAVILYSVVRLASELFSSVGVGSA